MLGRAAPALALVGELLVPQAAHGTNAPCASVIVVQRKGLSPSWGRALASLRADVTRVVPSDCSSVTVIVEPAGGRAHVLVATADGRQAERLVPRPDSLHAVAFGLLATIPPEHDAGNGALGASEANESPATSAPSGTSPREDAATAGMPSAVRAAPDLRALPALMAFHVAPSAGVRFAAPTGALLGEVQARFELSVRRWLFLAGGRYSVAAGRTARAVASDWVYSEAVVGGGIGYRVPVGASAFDFALIPEGVLANDVRAEATGSASPPPALVFRVQGAARVLLPLADGVRLAIGLDGEVTPLTPLNAVVVDPLLPPLPTWTVALAAGASWDVP